MRFARIFLFLVADVALAASPTFPRSLARDAYFEANCGQADPSVAFVASGPGYAALLERDGSARYRFPEGELRIALTGANAAGDVKGQLPMGSTTNYYGAGIKASIPHYARVRFSGVYQGIDLYWRSQGADLEYEFRALAGSDPRRIRIRFEGAERVSVDLQGNLNIETAGGRIEHRRPEAWQEAGGKRRTVPIGIALQGGTATFRLGRYDPRRPLWIDPVVAYSTYIGGAGYDAGYAITTDRSGGVYMTGTTGSIGFPAQGSGVNGNTNAFVMKFNESGSLIYDTILAGNGNTSGQSIAVDSAGNAYIAGTTQAVNFPVTKGAWQTVFGGVADAFAAKLDPVGNLLYATYIGGTGQETGTGIAIDSSGNAYVSGFTSAMFPTTAHAAQTVYAGGFADAFVVKLNASGNAAVYSTLLGGTGNDEAEAITVDAAGHACIAGYTDSTDLPVVSGLQSAPGGEGDALIACLSADGSAWTMVSYFGGSNVDQAYALAIDVSGNLYVAGTTFSQDLPVTAGVFQTIKTGSYDAFLAEFSAGGVSLIYSTYLGGNGSDAATAVVPGSNGDVWIGGYTTSTNFPLSGAWQSTAGSSFDGFIAHFSANATSLLTSSYLGGSLDDRVLGIALDADGLVFATGSTLSANFPVTPGAMQGAAPAGMNAFLVSISPWSYAISGHITLAGAPLSGVPVSLSGTASASIATDANGNFTFNNLGSGNYTVTPSLAGYTFSPASSIFNNLSANQIANFTATAGFSISGNAALAGGGGLRGVVVMLSGSINSLAVTDASGNYSFNGLHTGSYTVLASLKGYSFSPVSKLFSGISSNQIANFTASVSVFPGTTELVWQDPVSGFSQFWFMGGAQGTTLMGAATITTSNIWRIAAVADFNGDGYADIVWQDPVSGASQIWFLGGPQGTTLLEAASFNGPNSWLIVASADFNRDGHPDLVWQDPVSGLAQIWYLGGSQGITLLSAANLTLRNPWHIVGSGDFDGDGQPDLVWQDPVSGTVQIWYLTGALGNALKSAANVAASKWNVVAVADFNQDHHPDLVWQDPVSGASQIWLLTGAQGTTQLGVVSLSGPNSWRIVGPR